MSFHLRDKYPDPVKRKLKNGSADRILRQARNMAKCFGFQLDVKQLISQKHVASLIDELEKKSHENIDLYDDGEGKLYLKHFKYMCSAEIFMIPLKPTWSMRPEMGLIARRFLRALSKRFSIESILEQRIYEYESECFDENITECEENYKRTGDPADLPNNFLEGARYDAHLSYKEGEAFNALEEYGSLTPLTLDELLAFRPVGNAERAFVKFMKQGFKLMSGNICIWDYAESASWTESEREMYYENGFIGIEECFMVSYDNNDTMAEVILNSIETSCQSGAYCEGFVTGGYIPEKEPITSQPEIMKCLNYIDNFIGELNKFNKKDKSDGIEHHAAA